MSVLLSDADLSRLSALTSVLLSPLNADCIDDWRRDACRALGALVGGDQLFFLAAPIAGVDVMWAEGMSDTLRAAYSAQFTHDDGIRRVLRKGASAYNQTSIIAGDWWGYEHDRTLNELFVPHGVHDTIGLILDVEADSRPHATGHRFHLGAAGSPYGTEAFGDTGLAMMRLVAPAFEAGVATLLAADAWRASLATALDTLVTPAWVFSERGDNVLHRNASAGLLAEDDPQSPLVEAAVSALARELAGFASHSKSAGDHQSTVRANMQVRTAIASYSLRGSYVAPVRLAPSQTILVVAGRTAPRRLDLTALRDRYAFSPRELQIAELTFDGFAAGEIAPHLGISVHTVRRHMEQLYRKLGVHSRGEAQRTLVASVARLE